MEYPILKRGWLGGKTTLYISSPFGPRKRPTKGASTYHRGIDIAVPVGTEIKAPFKGTLVGGGIDKRGGLYCSLRQGSLELRFMHLSSCAAGETKGKTSSVSEGQTIGKTGGAKGDKNSGVSTGPHLHLEYRWNDSQKWTRDDALNPARFLSEKLVGVISRDTLSQGLPIKVVKKTYKVNEDDDTTSEVEIEEIKGYEVGDDNDTKMISFSEADLLMDNDYNSAYETDDSATEPYEIDTDNVDEEPEEDELEANEEYAKGVWQIVKLAMDSSVQDLLLYDATVSVQTGSILGFFNKACQQPLVEFYGDTYGDQYFFIVRRPPFDKKHMIDALSSQGIFDINLKKLENLLRTYQKGGEDAPDWDFSKDMVDNLKKLSDWASKFGFGSVFMNKIEAVENEIRQKKETQEIQQDVYTITNEDIISVNVDYNNDNIYSWYQFYPQFECAGDDMQYLVPAVLFPEYAAIWGSRALQIQSQYASFKGLGVRDKVKNDAKSEAGDKRCRTILDDLKYLIESNAYAPFVRQGTITIKGTRRIKRGMFIQVCIESLVEEVFYVESVSQSYSMTNNVVQRTTTLQLSHGMVKPFIQGVKINGKNMSYFDIIDFTGYEENRDQISLGNWREVISKWKVNLDVFKFFIKRLQFIVPGYSVDE